MKTFINAIHTIEDYKSFLKGLRNQRTVDISCKRGYLNSCIFLMLCSTDPNKYPKEKAYVESKGYEIVPVTEVDDIAEDADAILGYAVKNSKTGNAVYFLLDETSNITMYYTVDEHVRYHFFSTKEIYDMNDSLAGSVDFSQMLGLIRDTSWQEISYDEESMMCYGGNSGSLNFNRLKCMLDKRRSIKIELKYSTSYKYDKLLKEQEAENEKKIRDLLRSVGCSITEPEPQAFHDYKLITSAK